MRKLMSDSAVFVLVSLAALNIGCGASARQQATLQTPSAQVSGTMEQRALPPYRLGFGDILEVKFFNNREFNETVPVRPDGRITIEKVGDIEVAGRTPAYVDSIVTEAYSKFVRNPEVTVIVREFGSNQVYVFGEVNTPGRFAIEQEMTLVQAVAGAGGPKDTAKLSSVLIIRRGANGRPVASRVDLWKLANQNEENEMTTVRPLDVIYVPRNFISDLSIFMTKFYAAVIPPFDAYLRALLYSRE